MDIKKLITELYETNTLKEEELAYIIENIDEESMELLFELSLKTKMTHYGDSVFMRGLIEFTNYCKQNCDYCGIRRDNKEADRYRLTEEQILDCCREGHRLGYRTFVMQGGEDPYFTDEVLVDLIKKIKAEFSDVAITLSIGERSKESYQNLFDAGADRYLLRHETADKEIYENIHPGMSFDNRRQCLKDIKEIGFQVGAGFMVGLPGQGPKELAKDLMFLKELQPHMIGIGPYIPHEDTPLGPIAKEQGAGGTMDSTRVMLALTRMLLPKVLLPSTTALGTLDNLGREKALKVGANVVMPNLSPTNVREKYELYKDKICTGDEAAHCRGCIERRINSAGFNVDMTRGDHLEWRR